MTCATRLASSTSTRADSRTRRRQFRTTPEKPVLNEGTAALSGGQVQRLLIARALAGRPRMVVLDEATSALDNVTQSIVSRNIDRLGITRVIVAHRLR